MPLAMPSIPAETLRQLYDATRSAREVQRDITTASGLVNYELQRPAKQITPLYFPLADLVPRIDGIGGTQTNYKLVTALNTQNFEGAVAEGARAKTLTTTTSSAVANYVTLYQEDAVSFEEEGAAAGFEDIRATTAMRTMWSTLQIYENMLLAGNTGLALGTPTAPTLVDVGSGGGIATGTAIFVRVVALTAYGMRFSTVAAGVVQPVTYTAPDGTTQTEGYGASQKSASSTLTTGSNSDSVTATTPVVNGALGYAWFWGANNTTTCTLGAITSTNSVKITVAAGTGTQAASVITADNSQNPLAFDGLMTLAFANGTIASTIIQMATGVAGTGTGLTAGGAGNITELDNLLRALWDTQRISPAHLVVNSQELQNMNTKIIANGGAPLIRFAMDAGSGVDPIMGGRVIGYYLNPFTIDGGQVIPIMLHPNCPKGTILAFADRVPIQLFPGNNLGQLYEYRMPPYGDIRQIEWPLRTRKYETGVSMRGVLTHYFPKSLGIITNIGNA